MSREGAHRLTADQRTDAKPAFMGNYNWAGDLALHITVECQQIVGFRARLSRSAIEAEQTSTLPSLAITAGFSNSVARQQAGDFLQSFHAGQLEYGAVQSVNIIGA